MLKGKMIASGMFATCRCRSAMMPLHVERVGMTLVPRLQPDEDRAEVRLVGARHHAVAADGRERVDPFGLGQDLLDLGQHPARALERGRGRQLTLTPKMPWSSSGMKPAGSAPPKRPAPTATAATITMVRIERRTRRREPPTYPVVARSKTRLNQPKNSPSGPLAGPWCALSSMARAPARATAR